MTSKPQTQQDLETLAHHLEQETSVHVARETKQIIGVKRKRNDMESPSTIRSLPTEILCKIFLLVASTRQFVFKTPKTISANTIQRLALCHVCHDWRVVALGFPELWTEIEVHDRTKARMIEFMVQNAKSMPISFTFCNVNDNHSPPREMDTIGNTLAAMPLRSVYISGRQAEHVVQALPGSQSDELKELCIHTVPVPNRFFPLRILEKGARNLRKLVLSHRWMSWSSGLILHAPRLTVIEVPVYESRDSLKDIHRVLGTMHELQVLAFTLVPIFEPRRLHESEHNPWNFKGPRINLTGLRVLRLRGCLDMALSFLSLISLSRRTRQLMQFVITLPSEVDSFGKVLGAYGAAVRSGIRPAIGTKEALANPTDLIVGRYKAERNSRRPIYRVSAFSRSEGNTEQVPSFLLEILVPLEAGANLETMLCTSYFIPSRPEYDSCGPFLDNLQSFVSPGPAAPREFWAILAQLPRLSCVKTTSLEMDRFLPLLHGDGLPPDSIPFPALALLFMHKLGRAADVEEAKTLGAALKSRQMRIHTHAAFSGTSGPPPPAKLTQLVFENRPEPLDPALYLSLSTVASEILWKMTASPSAPKSAAPQVPENGV